MNYQKSAHYFDHNATTPLCAEVVQFVPDFLHAWGNPSSIHWAGREPKNFLRDTRQALAKNLGCHPLEIVFTSGGSESNNTIIKGLFEKSATTRRDHFMCSAVEHPSVLKTMQYLSLLGASVDIIPVNRAGQIDLEFYQSRLTERTALVSVMAANNETGTMFPIREMAAMAHKAGALFHTDAVQMFGKDTIDLHELGVDFASFSGHKFYSIKGSGFFYSKKGTNLIPLVHGGGQERHRRGGTENVLGIACLGVVAGRLSEVAAKKAPIQSLRDHLELRILNEITSVEVTAPQSPRLSNTSSLIIEGVDGETMLMSLDIKGYAVSTGAACSSGNPEPSPVLLAMGLSRDEAQSSLRISLGWENTLAEVDEFVELLKSVVQRLRAIEFESGETYHV